MSLYLPTPLLNQCMEENWRNLELNSGLEFCLVNIFTPVLLFKQSLLVFLANLEQILNLQTLYVDNKPSVCSPAQIAAAHWAV